MPEFRPNLKGVVPAQAEFAIRNLYDRLYGLAERTDAVERLRYLPFPQAESLYGPQPTRNNLQASGVAPLNVQGLLGVLAQPQMAGVPSVAALPGWNDPQSQDGALVALLPTLTVYRFNGSTSPGVWQALAATAVLTYGLRAAKPAAGNPGYLYFEADTSWLYYDNGANYVYGWGTNYGTNATRAGIGVAAVDDGALFFTSDTHVMWRVIAGAWVQITPNIAVADLTGQAAAIGATTLFTPIVTGLYRIRAYGVCTTAGAGIVSTVLTWTDDAQAQQMNVLGDFSLVGLGFYVQSDSVIRATSGVPVQYTTTIPGLGGGAQYALFIHAETG